MARIYKWRQLASDIPLMEYLLKCSTGLVTIKDWFQRPISQRPGDTIDQTIPRADLQAARPPAVKLWEDFENQAEAYFGSVEWPSVQLPELWKDGLDDIHEYYYTTTEMPCEEAASRLIRMYNPNTKCCNTEFTAVRKARGGYMIQLDNKNLVAVMTFGDREYNDLSKFHEYTQESEDDTCIQRLVDRIYGHLIWTGVSYGVLVTCTAYYFMYIDPSTCNLLVSSNIKHEGRDFTAKQGLAYILDLASKQAPFDMLANLGPRKLNTRSKEELLKVLGDNVQILRVDDIDLGDLLGIGNGAAVYDAKVNGIPVALKVAHMGGAHDDGGFEDDSCSRRLAQEAEVYDALKALQGSIIPQIYAHGLIDSRVGNWLPFLAMEKVEGTTLDNAAASMSSARIHDVVKAVLEAYRQLHAQGYCQGSVKEVNAMLRSDGRAVIIDFGRGENLLNDPKLVLQEKKEVHQMLEYMLARKMCKEETGLLSQYFEELSREETRCAGRGEGFQSGSNKMQVLVSRMLLQKL